MRIARAVLLAASLAPGLGCGPRPAPEALPERIVLVSIDTLRADHVGCYGAAGAATPQLDTIATQGVRFEAAFSPVPLTLPAHATLMTGLEPPAHGIRHNLIHRLAPTVPTLASQLAAAGYATAAFVGARVLERRFGLDRGFGHYDDDVTGTARGPMGFAERPADRVVDAALAWIAEAPPRFFLWVHLYDPHQPFDPPPGFASAFASRPYDGEIAFADAEMGRLLAGIRARFGEPGLLVVATADHGESLGEHGEPAHGYSLYDATQRVPLLISGPGVPAGLQVAQPVSLVDVAPTILALAGVEPLEGATGRDLGALLHAGELEGRPVYLETLATQLDFGWSPIFALRTERFEYVSAPRPELYDLAADPRQQRDIARDQPEIAARLASELDARRAAPPAPTEAAEIDAALSRQLGALGYATAVDPGDSTRLGVVGGIDPKDVRPHLARFAEAQLAAARGDAAAALALLRTLGDAPTVAAQRAAVSLAVGDLESARRDAGRVLAVQPRRGDVRVILAQALLALGRADEADEEIARLEPATVSRVPWVALRRAEALEGSGDLAAATEVLESARARHPEDVAIAARLGIALEAAGRLDEALAVREAALALDPASPALRNDVAWSLALGRRDLPRARALAESAARDRPGEPAILDTLAAIARAETEVDGGALDTPQGDRAAGALLPGAPGAGGPGQGAGPSSGGDPTRLPVRTM